MDYPVPIDGLLARLERPRSGWRLRGIPEERCETIAQHVRKVARAVEEYCADSPSFSVRRAYLMALCHDVPEILTHDYTPHDSITQEEKHRLERAAMEQLTAPLGALGAELLSLWEEYELRATPEARVVWQLDKIDPAIQALVYEKQGYSVAEFFGHARMQLTDPYLIHVLDALRATPYAGDPYRRYFSLLREKKNRVKN